MSVEGVIQLIYYLVPFVFLAVAIYLHLQKRKNSDQNGEDQLPQSEQTASDQLPQPEESVGDQLPDTALNTEDQSKRQFWNRSLADLYWLGSLTADDVDRFSTSEGCRDTLFVLIGLGLVGCGILGAWISFSHEVQQEAGQSCVCGLPAIISIVVGLFLLIKKWRYFRL